MTIPYLSYRLSARAEYLHNESRVALYLHPSAFPALAVRWYLAARAERESVLGRRFPALPSWYLAARIERERAKSV